MKPAYLAAFGLFVGGLGVQVAGLHGWQEAATPAFVGGALVSASGVIVALFTEKPQIK